MSLFLTEGWCSKDEVAELRLALLKYNITKDRVLDHPKDRYIHSLTASDIPCVQKIAERALEYVREKTGEKDLYFNETRGAVSLITAASQCVDQSWHRDTKFKTYAVCIPLVDVGAENGCTEILMKSTRTPASNWRRHWKDRRSVLCRAGDVYVFDSRLLHRGIANRTDTNRPMLCISIISARYKPFVWVHANQE